jgi:hypothetical protein
MAVADATYQLLEEVSRLISTKKKDFFEFKSKKNLSEWRSIKVPKLPHLH